MSPSGHAQRGIIPMSILSKIVAAIIGLSITTAGRRLRPGPSRSRRRRSPTLDCHPSKQADTSHAVKPVMLTVGVGVAIAAALTACTSSGGTHTNTATPQPVHVPRHSATAPSTPVVRPTVTPHPIHVPQRGATAPSTPGARPSAAHSTSPSASAGRPRPSPTHSCVADSWHRPTRPIPTDASSARSSTRAVGP